MYESLLISRLKVLSDRMPLVDDDELPVSVKVQVSEDFSAVSKLFFLQHTHTHSCTDTGKGAVRASGRIISRNQSNSR